MEETCKLVSFCASPIDILANPCIIQAGAEPENPALPPCNYSHILYRFFEFTQNLKQPRRFGFIHICFPFNYYRFTRTLFRNPHTFRQTTDFCHIV